MTNKNELKDAIDLINKHPDNYAWQDFSDRGNSCIGRYEDGCEEAINLGTVKFLIPKGGQLHLELNSSVARHLNMNYVTYDWLIKCISRMLSGCTYDDFKSMLELSVKVRTFMKNRGLTEITNISEAFC